MSESAAAKTSIQEHQRVAAEASESGKSSQASQRLLEPESPNKVAANA